MLFYRGVAEILLLSNWWVIDISTLLNNIHRFVGRYDVVHMLTLTSYKFPYVRDSKWSTLSLWSFRLCRWLKPWLGEWKNKQEHLHAQRMEMGRGQLNKQQASSKRDWWGEVLQFSVAYPHTSRGYSSPYVWSLEPRDCFVSLRGVICIGTNLAAFEY